LDCNGALAYGGGASFDGVITHVAGHKDARDAGLKEIGITVELP
jgi:hypothetical protein